MSFYNYMQNRAVGAHNPHAPTLDLSYLKDKVEAEKEPEQYGIKFDANMTVVLNEMTKRAGVANIGELINISLHILDNLIAAADTGKTDLFLVDPNTKQNIYMDLTKSLAAQVMAVDTDPLPEANT